MRSVNGGHKTHNHFGPSLALCVVATYNRKTGEWSPLSVKKTRTTKISAEANVIAYGQGVFEGIKAFRCDDGGIYTFRLRDSWKRMCASSARMMIPEVSEQMFMEAVNLAIRKNVKEFPQDNPLYVRPYTFNPAEDSSPGAGNEFMFMVTVKELHVPQNPSMKIWTETKLTRAVTGGVGFAKAAGNYAAALLSENIARMHGCDRTLWLDVEKKNLEEFSTMNAIIHIDDKLRSPQPGETIIDGITRRTIMTIAEKRGIVFCDKPISLLELEEGLKEKRVKGIMGSGTASIIIPATDILIRDNLYGLPPITPDSMSSVLTAEVNAATSGRCYTEEKWLQKVLLN